MQCPGCGGKTKVYNSRATAQNQVRRDRKCVKCPVRFTTFEKISSVANAPGRRSRLPPSLDRVRLRDVLVGAIERALHDA